MSSPVMDLVEKLQERMDKLQKTSPLADSKEKLASHDENSNSEKSHVKTEKRERHKEHTEIRAPKPNEASVSESAEAPSTNERESKGRVLLRREGLTFPENCVIGEGSYSKVKRAYSERMKREVAVKIVDRDRSSKEVNCEYVCFALLLSLYF